MALQTLLSSAGADETGTEVTVVGREHIVKVTGTFSGATVHLKASLHGSDFIAINDEFGSPVVVSGEIVDLILYPRLEYGYVLRADTVGGDGSTDISATVETVVNTNRC